MSLFDPDQVHDAELDYGDDDGNIVSITKVDNPFTRAIATLTDEYGDPMFAMPA